MSTINPRSMRIDPFFDRDGMAPGLAVTERSQVAGASPPTPGGRGGYTDAAMSRTEDNTPVSRAIPTGPQRLSGTIIPSATVGGIPQGTRPHDLTNMEVNIDPHIDGQTSRIRLRDLTPENIAAANAVANELVPEVINSATQRLKGAAIMHAIGAAAAAGRDTVMEAPQRAPAATISAPNMANIGTPVNTGRMVSPLAAFNQAPVNTFQGREHRAIDVGPTKLVQSPPPGIEVTFEVQHFGTHNAMYHDVIIQQGFIVLIFRTDYRGGGKYFPPSKENSPPFAVNITGTDEVYLVEPTGVQYQHDVHEYCVLMVNEVGSLTAATEAAQAQSEE